MDRFWGFIPSKETSSWMVFLGVIPCLIPCLSHQQSGMSTSEFLRPLLVSRLSTLPVGWFFGVDPRYPQTHMVCVCVCGVLF